jgi:recombination protein RecA
MSVEVMTDENKTNEDREHKAFMKTLKRQFEDAEVQTGKSLPLPKGNSTGSLSLDIDLKVPIYEGGIIEIFSNSGAGKTTLVLSIMSEAVQRGKRVLFLDQEQALQPTLVDSFPQLMEEGALTVMTLPTGEEALRCAEMWALQYPGSIIAIDSVDALIPKQTDDKDLGETDVGTLPKLMSAGCRKIMSAVGRSKSTVIFLNQLRSKIGTYGNPDTTSGGRALPFYSAQRIQLKDITTATRIMDTDGRQIGHTVRYKVVKNKVEAPFVEGEFPLIYGKGIDRYTELTTLAVDYGVLEKAEKGSYIMMPNAKGEMVKKPPKTVANMLKADPGLYSKVLSEVKALFPETFGPNILVDDILDE